MLKNIENFIGCDSEYADATCVLFGAPFDSTTSFRPGTRFAMKAMRSESFGIETYSPYQDKDLTDISVFDYGNMELPFGNTTQTLAEISCLTTKILEDNKLPVMVGGEHLVTLGAIRSSLEKYPNLVIIQFDAHTDLRENYLDQQLSHACVIRRAYDLVGDGRIFQFGIRSGEKSEFEWAKSHTFLNKFNFDGLKETLKFIGDRPIYFTLDLDVLDSSVFPGTGTPEAGGVSFNALLDAVIAVCSANVIAADINELSPIYDQSGSSTALACKILRELLLAINNKPLVGGKNG